MALAKRLAALAAHVPAGCTVADIGTDHAYLPVYLVEAGISQKVIATDINPGPLAAAARTVGERRLQDRIVLRRGDGLQPLVPGEAEVLVLAGMGGNTIREILAAAPAVLQYARRLVLQPMADAGDLRVWLAGNGWRIDGEQLVREDSRLYQIIAAAPGRESCADRFCLELGPRLIEGRDPLLRVYLEQLAARYERALAGLAAGRNQAAREKAGQLRARLERIREVAARCR